MPYKSLICNPSVALQVWQGKGNKSLFRAASSSCHVARSGTSKPFPMPYKPKIWKAWGYLQTEGERICALPLLAYPAGYKSKICMHGMQDLYPYLLNLP